MYKEMNTGPNTYVIKIWNHLDQNFSTPLNPMYSFCEIRFNVFLVVVALGLPRWHQWLKNLPASAGEMRHGFDPWVRKIHWRGAWQPTPVFLPGEFHGQRSLAGYGTQGHTELDTTESLSTNEHKQ